MQKRLLFLEQYNALHKTANVSRVTGEFLLFLTQLRKAKRVLEIGTSTGYSTLWFAQSGAEVHTIERRVDRVALARESFSEISTITLHEGDALQIIPLLPGLFDVLFLDATKREYLSYFRAAYTILSPGALIIADNVISHREKMHDFLEFVHSTYFAVEITLGSGLIIFSLPKNKDL